MYVIKNEEKKNIIKELNGLWEKKIHTHIHTHEMRKKEEEK